MQRVGSVEPKGLQAGGRRSRRIRLLVVLGLLALALPAASATPAAADVGANDAFASATPVGSVPTTLSGSTVNATGEAGEPVHGPGGGPIASAWWWFAVTTPGLYSIDTCGSDFDTVLAVYTGASVDALTVVASNDDNYTVIECEEQSRVVFEAQPLAVYWIAVDGYGGAQGSVTLNVDEAEGAGFSGTVYCDGVPQPGVTVYTSIYYGDDSTITDGAGHYEFTGLDPGWYDIWITSEFGTYMGNAYVDPWTMTTGTDFDICSTGLLRVTTTPALPVEIVVDGIPRDSWGLNWVAFPVGMHEVCFGPMPGFTPPPCENVEVEDGVTTEVDGFYSQRGTLRVLTSPALPSTITVNGFPTNNWGVWTDLDPGTYEVCFGVVADHTAPACQDAVITAGVTTTITGVFTSSPGAPGPDPSTTYQVRATTDPAVASRLRLLGTPIDTWGLTWLTLPIGFYGQLCYEGVLYATTPNCDFVYGFVPGATVEVVGEFVVHGFLRVLTSPSVPATIFVDGEPANTWGVWTSKPPGTYEVCYGDVPGLTAPPCEDVVVTEGATATATGTYT